MINNQKYLSLWKLGKQTFNWVFVFLFLTSFASVSAAPIAHSPSEVLLVYNSNSPVSTAIANYYAAQRGITNVLAVYCEDSALSQTNEQIPYASYLSQIQTPISTYLSGHSGINFIVLTKGIPICIAGQDVGYINNGSWTEYNNVSLSGATTFTARVANPNSTQSIQICLDSPTGTVIGTCPVSTTGGYQTWTTNTCSLTSTTGTHNLYLVYSGGFNIEWFTVGSTNIPATSFNSSAGGVQTESSSEGGAPTGAEGEGTSPNNYNPSLDTFLAALGYSTANGNVQATITGSNAQGIAWVNKYYNAKVPFTHAAFGGYLVTRLDGYTQADATALVDNSLAATGSAPTGPILLAVDTDDGLGDKTTMPPTTPSTNVTIEENFDNGNADFLHAADILEASGITTDAIINDVADGPESNLEGYYSWGCNGDVNDVNYMSTYFAPGAIANTYVSSSGRTFLGEYVGFNSINLTGMTSMNARVANANGTEYFVIRIDSPSGQIIGNGTVPSTGGEETWTTVSCPITSVSGVHNVYLMYVHNGYGGDLYNFEWIAFQGVPSVIEASSYNTISGTAQAQTSGSEDTGEENIGYVTNGSYTEYNQLDLNGMTSFQARVSSNSPTGNPAGEGGNINIHLDSPTGTLVGTAAVTSTGSWSTWTNVTCSLSGASGYHNVYLVFNGPSGWLFNLERFNFLGGTNVIEAASYNTVSGGPSLETCSEGGEDLGNSGDGQTLMADLISNGLTGALGYVDEPTLNGSVGNTFAISNYEAGYNLAESLYVGTPYLGWGAIMVGDPLCAPYFGAMPPVDPTAASTYTGSSSGVSTESCGEGNLDVTTITNGSYTSYNSINLTGMSTFRARVASAGSGGNIQIRLGSATGTLIGTCAVPGTGGEQTWTTVTCSLSGASGTQNIYLVYTGGSGDLFSVEWYAFLPSIEASAYSSESSVQTETCAEGGLDVGYISDGSYTEYANVNLTGVTSFAARVASPGGGSTITIHLDSPTGTVIGTAAVPATGGWQTWTGVYCPLSGASGTHNVYLVYTSGMNIEWFYFGSSVFAGSGPITYLAYDLSYTSSGASTSLQTDTTFNPDTWVELAATGTGQSVTYTLPSVNAGTYQLQMQWKGNTNRGQLSLSVDGGAALTPTSLDQYAATQTYPITTFTPNLTFSTTGTHTIKLTVTGKNASSSGYYLSAYSFILTP